MPRSFCSRCGRIGPGVCPTCAANARRATYDNPTYRRNRTATITAWVQQHGNTCPGWTRGAHQVEPGELTVDHIVPIKGGGTHHPSNLTVLCRSCNSSKGATPHRSSKVRATPFT